MHLSDLHLGFRQYQRLTPGGINQREADVAATFKQAIDQTIALRPDLVVIGGDVFHTVRPSNQAILHAFTQFSRLKQALTDTPIVIVAGNHDLPRSSDSGSILRLFAPLGIDVVEGGARQLSYPDRNLSVLAVPYALQWPKLTIDPSARYNVLVLHGVHPSVEQKWMGADERARNPITNDDLFASPWSYRALGHYHVYRQIGENTYYSGSIDYSSSDPWGELLEGREKGFIEHNLATGKHTFHALTLQRDVIDLPELWAGGLTSAELDARIRESVDSIDGGIDGKIVRLLVRQAARHIVRELNQAALRDYRRRALHFHLDTRRPEITRMHGGAAPGGRRPSLADVVREKLAARVLESDIDRDALVALGLRYLREAEALDAAAGIEGQSA
ncbi:MAG TPA: DNA repair exonuclease [Gemmatimonadaceae bacterium]|nr:DNA repair exonuclease [Gemmatimonadaceae bacterium]